MAYFDDTLIQRAAASVDRATGLALQADAASAAKELVGIPDGILVGAAADFRECMIQRFGAVEAAPRDFGVEDAWVAALVTAYVSYWQQALAKRVPAAAAEAELEIAVGALIGHPLAGSDPLDHAEME